MKIKAAILEETGCPLVVKGIDSQPLLEGQCLVKIIVSGVVSQPADGNQEKGVDKWLPHFTRTA